MGSALLAGHGPALCGFFRAAPVPHVLRSPAADIGTPFGCGADWVIVPVEDVEDIDEIEDEELVRCALFRGINIRATSSAFIELSPPWLTLAPHADRLFCWKLGGLATAVICQNVCEYPLRR
jgi:hypothetical protein